MTARGKQHIPDTDFFLFACLFSTLCACEFVITDVKCCTYHPVIDCVFEIRLSFGASQLHIPWAVLFVHLVTVFKYNFYKRYVYLDNRIINIYKKGINKKGGVASVIPD